MTVSETGVWGIKPDEAEEFYKEQKAAAVKFGVICAIFAGGVY